MTAPLDSKDRFTWEEEDITIENPASSTKEGSLSQVLADLEEAAKHLQGQHDQLAEKPL